MTDKADDQDIGSPLKFELENSLRGVTDDELLDDLRYSAEKIGRETITIAQYAEIGKAHPTTLQRRFGSWSAALKKAGLKPSRSKIGISDEELFENIRSVWINLGRQPRYSEVKAPTSRFSAGTYENRFGSWSKALHDFIRWTNSLDNIKQLVEENQSICSPLVPVNPKRTRREISERQRFRILLRDGFKCTACGASPLTKPGTELHVDHLVPWSKGGETTDDNLGAKCLRCNLGKGNAFDV